MDNIKNINKNLYQKGLIFVFEQIKINLLKKKIRNKNLNGYHFIISICLISL